MNNNVKDESDIEEFETIQNTSDYYDYCYEQFDELQYLIEPYDSNDY